MDDRVSAILRHYKDFVIVGAGGYGDVYVFHGESITEVGYTVAIKEYSYPVLLASAMTNLRRRIIFGAAYDERMFRMFRGTYAHEADMAKEISERMPPETTPRYFGTVCVQERGVFSMFMTAGGPDGIVSLMRGGEFLPEFVFRCISRDLAKRLAELHACGYAHTDFKLDNLLRRLSFVIGEDLEAPFFQLTDFASAVPLDDRWPGLVPWQCCSHETKMYRCPSDARGREREYFEEEEPGAEHFTDPTKVDSFALGMTLWLVCLGRLQPFFFAPGGAHYESFLAMWDELVGPPDEEGEDVWERFRQRLLDCEDRYRETGEDVDVGEFSFFRYESDRSLDTPENPLNQPYVKRAILALLIPIPVYRFSPAEVLERFALFHPYTGDDSADKRRDVWEFLLAREASYPGSTKGDVAYTRAGRENFVQGAIVSFLRFLGNLSDDAHLPSDTIPMLLAFRGLVAEYNLLHLWPKDHPRFGPLLDKDYKE